MPLKRPPKELPEENWLALEYEADQLFSPSTPIDMVDFFSGRKPQIRELLEAVAERGQHAVLYGERGVGKTSLTKVFHALFPSGLAELVATRVRAYPNDSFTSIWKRVFAEWTIIAKIEGKKQEMPLSDLYEGQITPDDVKREIMRLFGPNDMPIVIVDEFQEITDRSASAKMGQLIKTLSDEGVNATIIIVGVAGDIGEMIDGHKSIERCLRQVPMPRMLPLELEEILDRRIPRLGMTIDEDAQERIVNLSRGLPAYVHNLGKFAVRSAIHHRRLVVTEDDVDLAVDNVLKKTTQSNLDTYHLAVASNRKDARYRQSLLACALARTDEAGFFIASSVLEPLAQILKREVALSDFQKHLDLFQTKERGEVLIRRGSAKKFRYRFREPIIQPFVIMRGIRDGLISARSKSLLAYEPQRSLSI